MRLIDADALMELANNHKNKVVDANDIARFITIEAEPVRHGRWIDPEDNDGHTEWHCSYCGDVVCTTCGYPGANYCSFCGAKMDGGKE